ncbi:P-loop containing nucleoside triphosphate hydrolase protein [Linnemannia elongata]|uniref:p-loop containing nucleoside triphosphate hydrolase protein n=1 Tax=Linnemannia elongata AG-77 TaxID=1314771 RepID=A0A197JUZ1_9FUNG|nr:hypothetical protein BGZ89_011593 [Linnemannia elongata]KAH7060322.1 P-loop containing nucleoside triphosphate hydrolase protein [Linnemannia elongata]KAK5829447.1 P-loop containing nucleoside triphosphate hydrolase protein [Linnemannia elongata]OAQ28793.1 P-loop containing nucleoside triphosphate hydrolase protein [Linnemannia elongata AG-77]
MSINNNSLLTGTYSLILIGNPGVGKSAILNALGGNFHTGFSAVTGLTRKMTTKTVRIAGRRIRLVDIPGIFDYSSDGDRTIERHLDILHETLNDGSSYVIFFVIAPTNGRISPNDFTVMKALLDNLEQAPLVGLILTQIKHEHFDAVNNSGYSEKVQEVLQQANANLKFFDKNPPLVLLQHREQFTTHEDNIIKEYILGFEPTQVFVHRMVIALLYRIFTIFLQLAGVI